MWRMGLVFIIAVAGCGNDGPSEFIKADVKLPDESVTKYEAECIGAPAASSWQWQLGSTEYSDNHSMDILWTIDTEVVLPWTCELSVDTFADCELIFRIHDVDDLNQFVHYLPIEGTIVFNELGYERGDVVRGSFDNVVLYVNPHQPTGQENIILTNGSFKAKNIVGANL